MKLDALIYPLRGVQLVFNMIALGLIVHLFEFVISSGGIMLSYLSFYLFVGIWTFLALAFVIELPRLLPHAAHSNILLIFEVLTTIFWLAACVALAVWISFVPKRFCRVNCRLLQAAVGVGALESLLWIMTTVFTICLRRRRRSRNSPVGGRDGHGSTPHEQGRATSELYGWTANAGGEERATVWELQGQIMGARCEQRPFMLEL